MTADRPALAESIDPEAANAVVREGLVVLGIAFLTSLALFVPGAGREFPGVAITVADAIVAAGTTATVGSLLYAVPHVRELVSSAIVGSASFVDDIAATVGHLVAFGAVLIAHRGLAPVAIPLIAETDWVYDLAFFGFSGVLIALIGRRLYRSLDPIARLVTRELLDTTGHEPSGADA